MIINFEQCSRQPEPAFIAKMEDVEIANATGMTRKEDAQISFNNRLLSLSSVMHKETNDEGRPSTQITDIFCNGEILGRIYIGLVEQKKVLFLSFGYEYYSIEINKRKLLAYEVGFGCGEHYICFYEKDKNVAVIYMHDEVHNNLNKYDIYAEGQDDELIQLLCTFNLYFDCMRFPDIGDVTNTIESNESLLTTNKEQAEKYDPDFIPRIKAMHNII